nr:MAG TPA: hypothetical protein [Caudoviricetes sp.]
MPQGNEAAGAQLAPQGRPLGRQQRIQRGQLRAAHLRQIGARIQQLTGVLHPGRLLHGQWFFVFRPPAGGPASP